MTYPVVHTLMYDGKEYQLLGDSSEQLPFFDLIGVKSNIIATTGGGTYKAEYIIEQNALFLNSISIDYFLEAEEEVPEFPVINDVRPVLIVSRILQYKNIDLLMPITGHIVIGGEALRSLAYSLNQFNIILKVSLKDGQVTQIEDLSNFAASIRKKQEQIQFERDEQKKGKKFGTDYGFAHFNRRRDEEIALIEELRSLTGNIFGMSIDGYWSKSFLSDKGDNNE